MVPSYRADWVAAGRFCDADGGRFSTHYPVRLVDGCYLRLPLVPLPDGLTAVALLMSSQTSFAIEGNIVERLTALVRATAPDQIVGVPTLGLTYARAVAEAIGLPDFVALGHSRKFWYDDALSEAAVSSTSPEQYKRLYLDPALRERVARRRVVIVDDVLNTGRTMLAAVRLLRRAQAEIAGIVAVLTEGWAWHRALAGLDPGLPRLVRVLGHIPLFERDGQAWVPRPDTDAGARPGELQSGP
jgi:adenine/guanine phosphoribosyltransferase-like PRPP-binding protein